MVFLGNRKQYNFSIVPLKLTIGLLTDRNVPLKQILLRPIWTLLVATKTIHNFINYYFRQIRVCHISQQLYKILLISLFLFKFEKIIINRTERKLQPMTIAQNVRFEDNFEVLSMDIIISVFLHFFLSHNFLSASQLPTLLF